MRSRDIRAFRIAERGGTQKEKVAVWQVIAAWRPQVCADVGANYGEFAAAVVDSGLRVVVVEANPALVPCLERTFAGCANVTVVHAAASDQEGCVELYIDPLDSGASSLSEQAVYGNPEPSAWVPPIGKVTVPARKLDNLVPDLLGAWPDSVLLKIDVEGFEELVLRGAASLLERAGWWRALVEFNASAIRNAGRDPARFWDMLRAFRGVIVGKPGQETNPLGGDGVLPESPPYSCDVLVGQGTPR